MHGVEVKWEWPLTCKVIKSSNIVIQHMKIILKALVNRVQNIKYCLIVDISYAIKTKCRLRKIKKLIIIMQSMQVIIMHFNKIY